MKGTANFLMLQSNTPEWSRQGQLGQLSTQTAYQLTMTASTHTITCNDGLIGLKLRLLFDPSGKLLCLSFGPFHFLTTSIQAVVTKGKIDLRE